MRGQFLDRGLAAALWVWASVGPTLGCQGPPRVQPKRDKAVIAIEYENGVQPPAPVTYSAVPLRDAKTQTLPRAAARADGNVRIFGNHGATSRLDGPLGASALIELWRSNVDAAIEPSLVLGAADRILVQ